MISQTTTLHVHHAFLYISSPSLHDYNVKIISRFVEDVNARRRLPFSFPELSSKERLKFPYDNRAGEWSLGQVKNIYIFLVPSRFTFWKPPLFFIICLLVTFVRTQSNRREDCYPFCSLWHEGGYKPKKKNTRAFRQAKS